MSLKGFVASGGDIDHLNKATSETGKALLRGKVPDVQLNAATVAISAGYVYESRVTRLTNDHTRAACLFG